MKKFIAILFGLICLVSCNETRTVYVNPNTGQEYTSIIKDKVLINGKIDANYSVIEITVNGETHQYIRFRGLAHWEGCKYCKGE